MSAILATAIATDDRQDLTGDVTRTAWRGEEDEGRRDLLGLRRALHWRVDAEFRDGLGRLIGRIERRPDRPGRHDIDADAAIDQMRRQRAREGVNAGFSH